MRGCSVLLLSALLPFALQTGAAQTKADRHPASSVGVVSVEAPRHEFLDGYLRWLGRHPEAVPHGRPLIPAPSGVAVPLPQEAPMPPLVIRVPSIYLYSPSGVSIYHGTNSGKNVAFLRALPGSIRQATQEKTGEVVPTLRETVEMFAELKPYEAALLATKQYTIFAVTCTDTAHCKEQNAAIRQLGRRLRQISIGVIEVRLHQ